MPHPMWAVGGGIAAFFLARVDYNLFFMRFFRDLSRGKARARLYGNKYALVPVMLGIEQPLKIQDDIEAEKRLTITREELEEFDGFDGAPLYLSIRGRVYDVTAGSKFYGEGKEYHDLVGKDASRSFGTGCRVGVDRTGEDCLSESIDGLNAKEMKEIDRWLELYETHDQYTFVGHLIDDPVDEFLEEDDEDEETEQNEEKSDGSEAADENESREDLDAVNEESADEKVEDNQSKGESSEITPDKDEEPVAAAS